MKLYDVEDGSKVKVIKGYAPPGAPMINPGDVLKFSHIDGMFSVCFRDGERCYLSADAEVEITT